MKSLAIYSFVLSFLAAELAAFVIIDGELKQAFNDVSEGVGDFSVGVSDLFKKVSQTKKSQGTPVLDIIEGDQEEELGGAGIDPRIVYALNKTSGSAAKLAQEVINQLVTKTGINKLGVPVIKEDSEFKDYVRYQMSNLLMGTSVAAAAIANIIAV